MTRHSHTPTDATRHGDHARRFAVALTAITGLALLIRLFRLDFESLWYDELTQVSTYSLPLSYLVTASAGHGQPPLDYLIGAGLHRMGLATSDWWVRFPSALFGTLCVALTGILGRRIAGNGTGLTAALLLCVCPLHVVMSQEARPYTIFVCLTVAFVLALDHARRRHTIAAWALLTVTTTALILTRWVGPQLVVITGCLYATGAWIMSRRSKDSDFRTVESQRLWALGTTIAISYAIYGPVLGLILDRARGVIASAPSAFAPRFAEQLLDAFQSVWGGYSTQVLYHARPAPEWLLVTGAMLVIIGLATLVRRASSSQITRIFLTVLVPFGLLYAALYAALTPIHAKPQYLLLISIPVVILASRAIVALANLSGTRHRAIGHTVVAVLIAVLLVPMVDSTRTLLNQQDKRDWRVLMSFLQAHAQENDAFAVAGADTVPGTFHPAVGGKTRYGMGHARFLPVDLNTSPESLTHPSWVNPEATVWIVGIKDRLYTGSEQLPAPARIPDGVILGDFPGVFAIGIRGDASPSQRLAHGLGLITEHLPDRSAVVAPLVVRGRLLLNLGLTEDAADAFARAHRQCRSQVEQDTLERDYLPQGPSEHPQTALRSD